MNSMRLNKLVYEGKHGFDAWEKETAQRFEVDVELKFDFDASVKSDNIEDSLDWRELRDTIRRIVENESFNLVETLAGHIAESLFTLEKIQELEVSVRKLDIWGGNGFPSITVRKSR